MFISDRRILTKSLSSSFYKFGLKFYTWQNLANIALVCKQWGWDRGNHLAVEKLHMGKSHGGFSVLFIILQRPLLIGKIGKTR